MNLEAYQDKTDEELAKLSAEDPHAFVPLVKRYEGKLLAYIRRISGFQKEDAEDVLQEAFMDAYRHIADFDSAFKFSSWMYRITDPSGSVWQIKLNSGIRLPKQVESGACLRVFGETSTNSREMVAEVISSCPRGVRLKMSKPSDEIRASTVRIINYAPSMVWLRSNS